MRDRDAVMQTAVENAIDNTKIVFAKMMKNKGEPIEKIIEYTGFTKEQIDKL